MASVHYHVLGKEGAPTLFCVPGLLGGPEDFVSIIKGLEDRFRIIMLDPNFERRMMGFKGVSVEAMKEFDMDVQATTDMILNALDELKQDKAWMIGISLGGKIIYDFITKYPDRFRGGLVTDMGPASFQESELFKFVDTSVLATNMNLPWPEMKKDLQERVPERHIRSLIQTQLHYPKGPTAPAEWRVGMANFRDMLQVQAIDDQVERLRKVDAQLAEGGHILHVLKASRMSAITPASYDQILTFKSLQVHHVPESNHFLHISHKDLIQDKIREFAGQ